MKPAFIPTGIGVGNTSFTPNLTNKKRMFTTAPKRVNAPMMADSMYNPLVDNLEKDNVIDISNKISLLNNLRNITPETNWELEQDNFLNAKFKKSRAQKSLSKKEMSRAMQSLKYLDTSSPTINNYRKSLSDHLIQTGHTFNLNTPSPNEQDFYLRNRIQLIRDLDNEINEDRRKRPEDYRNAVQVNKWNTKVDHLVKNTGLYKTTDVNNTGQKFNIFLKEPIGMLEDGSVVSGITGKIERSLKSVGAEVLSGAPVNAIKSLVDLIFNPTSSSKPKSLVLNRNTVQQGLDYNDPLYQQMRHPQNMLKTVDPTLQSKAIKKARETGLNAGFMNRIESQFTNKNEYDPISYDDTYINAEFNNGKVPSVHPNSNVLKSNADTNPLITTKEFSLASDVNRNTYNIRSLNTKGEYDLMSLGAAKPPIKKVEINIETPKVASEVPFTAQDVQSTLDRDMNKLFANPAKQKRKVKFSTVEVTPKTMSGGNGGLNTTTQVASGFGPYSNSSPFMYGGDNRRRLSYKLS